MSSVLDRFISSVNNPASFTPENIQPSYGMTTWAVNVLNQYCHIVDRSYHTGWYQEEAEHIARERCAALGEFSWQVIRLN